VAGARAVIAAVSVLAVVMAVRMLAHGREDTEARWTKTTDARRGAGLLPVYWRWSRA